MDLRTLLRDDTMVYLLTSVHRDKALDIYYKLHVDLPYLTKDRERQGALAGYTGQTTKQVHGSFADFVINLTTCVHTPSRTGRV